MKTKAAILALTVAAVGYSLSAGTSAFALDSQTENNASDNDGSATVMIVGPGMSEAPLLAQAEHPGGFMPMSQRMCEMKSEHMKAFMADLNLTDAQIEKLAQLKDDFKDKAEPICVKLHSLKRQSHHLLLQAQIDTDAVSKVHSQIQAQKKLLDGYLIDYLVAKAQVLTPEQRHKIELAMDKRELRPHGFHHHGGFHGSWS
jgi:Spy/CpxP family protein refolding chaperone